MIKFKEFLRECSFIEEQSTGEVYWSRLNKLAKNDYRHSMGLPDEDEIQQDTKLTPVPQGIQPSVKDEARRRIAIEDDVMLADVELPFLIPQDTDTPRERKDKLTNRITNSLSMEVAARNMTDKDMSKIKQDNQKRLRQTTDNIVNDRKAQFPDLAKEQEELTDTDKKLETKEKVLRGVLNQIPASPPIGTTKIVNYLKNYIGTMYRGTVNDWYKNMERQTEMPWNSLYGLNPTIVNSGDNSQETVPYTPNPDFEQTRIFTADPVVAVPQENEHGIRLGRVDYSRKNK